MILTELVKSRTPTMMTTATTTIPNIRVGSADEDV
jgi:hypothetical protein